jgi:pyridoxamine 5'-phosphate oxidase
VPELREQDVDPDPLRQFRRWLGEAVTPGAPVAVVLATATPAGRPSARVVLLKAADERGLTVFTSYASRKGRELAENPRAALVVHWPEQGRQVRVEGAAARIPADESDAYFASRPPGSRLSAAASPQSEVVPSRAALEALVDGVRKRHGEDPPRPETWGGLRVVPEVWEFWQHGPDRLHDRLRYRHDGGIWLLDRLAP